MSVYWRSQDQGSLAQNKGYTDSSSERTSNTATPDHHLLPAFNDPSHHLSYTGYRWVANILYSAFFSVYSWEESLSPPNLGLKSFNQCELISSTDCNPVMSRNQFMCFLQKAIMMASPGLVTSVSSTLRTLTYWGYLVAMRLHLVMRDPKLRIRRKSLFFAWTSSVYAPRFKIEPLN